MLPRGLAHNIEHSTIFVAAICSLLLLCSSSCMPYRLDLEAFVEFSACPQTLSTVGGRQRNGLWGWGEHGVHYNDISEGGEGKV